MDKLIKIILILILIVLAVSFIFILGGEKISDFLNNDKVQDSSEDDEGLTDSSGSGGFGSDDSAGVGGAGSSEIGAEQSGSGEQLPDFESASCGFYYGEYGVCAGTCPTGVCVSEGRSCYCKVV